MWLVSSRSMIWNLVCLTTVIFTFFNHQLYCFLSAYKYISQNRIPYPVHTAGITESKRKQVIFPMSYHELAIESKLEQRSSCSLSQCNGFPSYSVLVLKHHHYLPILFVLLHDNWMSFSHPSHDSMLTWFLSHLYLLMLPVHFHFLPPLSLSAQ